MSIAPNKVSTLNSTSTALGAAGTWTGTAEFAYAYESVVVAAKSDVAGTLYIDFSTDGTNWDGSLTYLVTAGINEVHRLTVTREYFRVRYVNGSTEQGYFRLETMMGAFPILSAPRNLSVQQDADAIVVRPTDYHYEVAMGRINGCTTWNKFGYNLDIDTGASETVWSVGGLFAPMAAAGTLNVVSSSTDDDAAGLGAQSIIIYGVDANREALIEVVQMDGTNPVTTSGTFFGVNRAAIYLSGATGWNVGNITITATTGGSTQAQIPATGGTTQHAFFFTQASHTALLDYLKINTNKIGGSSPVVTILGYVTSFVSGSRFEVFRAVIDTSVENTVEIRPSQPFVVGEKSIIEFQATTTVSNTVCSIRFSFIEERN